MKELFLLISLLYFSLLLSAQNVGIGTNDPQNKLHVAGGVRIDALNGASGIVTKNTSGDLSSVPYTGNSEDVLRGNGSFSPVTGLVPSSGVVISKTYNNNELINAGFSLIGEMPKLLTYSTTNATFPANTWQPTYTRGIQGNVSAPEYGYTGDPPLAIWAGNIMYVINFTGIYSYDPYLDKWTFLSNSIKGGGIGDKVIWTGSEIILWKGQNANGQKYNPSNNTTTNLPTTNAPSSRYYHTMTWDGTRVIVWGGLSGGAAVNNGGMYNPATGVWTVVSNANAPLARQRHTAIWSTSVNRLIIWGGTATSYESANNMNSGAFFNPETNTWTGATNLVGAPAVRYDHEVIWTGNEMVVFGGIGNGTSLKTGSRFNPSTNTWGAATSTIGAPSVSRHALVWTGTEMYVSGGLDVNTPSSYLYKYDLGLNNWTTVTNFKETKFRHHCFYNSNMLLIWGGLEKMALLENLPGLMMALHRWQAFGK